MSSLTINLITMGQVEHKTCDKDSKGRIITIVEKRKTVRLLTMQIVEVGLLYTGREIIKMCRLQCWQKVVA